MKRYSILSCLSIVVLGGLLLHAEPAFAQADERKWLPLGQETISRGYTVELPSQDLRLAVMPGMVQVPVNIDLKRFGGDNLPDPAGMTRVSDYFIYDVLRQDQTIRDPLVTSRPFVVAVRFTSGNLWRKRVFFWTGTAEGWRPLPSSIDYAGGYVRAITHLPFSRIAVFEDQNGTEGHASWYRSSRYPYGVATNDFPMGTKLRVRSVENGKTVDVTVVSTGPFRPFSERRVVDLSLTAFRQIAQQSAGTTRVQVWKLSDTGTVLGIQTTVAPSGDLPLSSRAAVATDSKTGQQLFAKNANEVLPIASLTKVMTAVIFLETNTPMDQAVTYDENLDGAIGSKLYVKTGETMRVKDLWYSGLVGSANNAINALARSTGLTREEFARRMNAKAASWGLTQTKFVDVTGLDPANVSTAAEYAVVASRALQDLRILIGTMTPVYSFTTLNLQQPHTIKNKNLLVGGSWYLTGTKTGYLDEAKYNLMARARQSRTSSREVITVVLGNPTDAGRYSDTHSLLKYAFSLP